MFKNELLKFSSDDNFSSYYVFISGCTGNDVFLYLNQLNKRSCIVIDRKTSQLVKKNNRTFNFKILSENCTKVNINILGHSC